MIQGNFSAAGLPGANDTWPDPDMIPFTVLSRCQRYDLRRISASEIVERLSSISTAEELTISEASLLAIAKRRGRDH